MSRLRSERAAVSNGCDMVRHRSLSAFAVPAFSRVVLCKVSFLVFMAVALLISGSGVGCASEPSYEVESYQALQEEFRDYPDVIFADIAKYQDCTNMTYRVYFEGGGCSNKVSSGYSASYDGVDMDNIGIDTVLLCFTASVTTMAGWPPDYQLDSNTVYRGINVNDFSSDMSEDSNPQNTSESFRQGSYIYALGYGFILHGCYYEATGLFALTSEELQTHDAEQVRQAAKEELFALIDSILDQGGVAK